MSKEIPTPSGTVLIRQAEPIDAAVLREIRLEALQNHPEVFGSDVDSEMDRPLTFWEEMLADLIHNAVFVAEFKANLIGMTGIFIHDRIKLRHTGNIWGVYVQPGWRGLGIADQLIQSSLNWAKEKGLQQVKLAVITSNPSAIHLYERCGFREYGIDPNVIQWQGVGYDEILMVFRF
jgi:ribosomal protein S18 acetylase RimI-like enzyme